MLAYTDPLVYVGLARPYKRVAANPMDCFDFKYITDTLLPYFELSEEDLFRKSRLSHIVEARMIIIYLALKTGHYTTMKLGKMFKMDHSTIVYYRIKVNNLMSVDKVYKARVENAEALLFS